MRGGQTAANHYGAIIGEDDEDDNDLGYGQEDNSESIEINKPVVRVGARVTFEN